MLSRRVVLVAAAVALCSFASAAKTGKWFDHIVIIQFENHSKDEVLADPNFQKYVHATPATASGVT